jgi:hypothetical protein
MVFAQGRFDRKETIVLRQIARLPWRRFHGFRHDILDDLPVESA